MHFLIFAVFFMSHLNNRIVSLNSINIKCGIETDKTDCSVTTLRHFSVAPSKALGASIIGGIPVWAPIVGINVLLFKR
jgi:hypothetical protein